MRDVIQHIEPGQTFALQNLRGQTVFLLHDGGKDVADAYLFTTGRLHMRHRSLQHILQADRLFRHIPFELLEGLEVLFEKKLQVSAQGIHVAATGLEDLASLFIEEHGIEHMFRGQELVMPTLRLSYGKGKGYLHFLVKHGYPSLPQCYGDYARTAILALYNFRQLQKGSNRFQRAAQRKTFPARQIVNLAHLGFGNLIGERATDPGALEVDVEHNPVGLGRRFMKNRHQCFDDKLHRRVVVVMHQDRVHWWLLGPGAPFYIGTGLIAGRRFCHFPVHSKSRYRCQIQATY